MSRKAVSKRADALHSATDLLALGASWFGLLLASRRPTERFPYGFYRAETLAGIGPGGEVDGTAERNPFQDKEVRAGLAVINRFVKEKRLDAVFVREIGEIAYHALRDNYVEIFLAPDGTVENALRAYREGRLEHLPRPTHSSEEKLVRERTWQ